MLKTADNLLSPKKLKLEWKTQTQTELLSMHSKPGSTPPLADPRGARDPRGPISFIFMQFSAKILPYNRLSHRTQGLAAPCRLANPGSATAFLSSTVKIGPKRSAAKRI